MSQRYQHEIDLRSRVPGHTLPSIDLYVEQRIPPGDFLLAVLRNDLKESFARADMTNRAALFDIVNYLYNCVPGKCWGTPERVEQWLNPEEKDDND